MLPLPFGILFRGAHIINWHQLIKSQKRALKHIKTIHHAEEVQVAQIVPPDCNLRRTLMDVHGLEPERRHQSLVDSSASQGQYLGIKGQQKNVSRSIAKPQFGEG